MATAEKILELARKELGYKESPANSNKTKYGKWYGLNGNPWCMMFVMWLFNKAKASDLLPMRTASCGEFMRESIKLSNWLTQDYQPGDIVIFDFPGNAVPTDHVGIVERVEEGNAITIEGNTAAGNDSNGGQVMRRTRDLSLIVGAFRPAYEEEGFLTGTLVKFLGALQYFASGEGAASLPAMACMARVGAFQSGTAHPYYLYGDNVEGWVDAADIGDAEEATPEPAPASDGETTPEAGEAAGSKIVLDAEVGETLMAPVLPETEIPVSSQLVLVERPIRIVEVTAKSVLRVRSGPGTGYAQLDTLPPGQQVPILEQRNGWGRLYSGGWVSLKYTKTL